MIPPARPLAAVLCNDGLVYVQPTQTPRRLGLFPHPQGSEVLPDADEFTQELAWVFPHLASQAQGITPGALRDIARKSFDYSYGVRAHRVFLEFMPHRDDGSWDEKATEPMAACLNSVPIHLNDTDAEFDGLSLVAKLENVIDIFGADTGAQFEAVRYLYRKEYELATTRHWEWRAASDTLRYRSWDDFIAQENQWIERRRKDAWPRYAKIAHDTCDVWRGVTPYSQRVAAQKVAETKAAWNAEQQAKRESDARIRAAKAQERTANALAREANARQANANRLAKSQEDRNYAAAKWSRSHSKKNFWGF